MAKKVPQRRAKRVSSKTAKAARTARPSPSQTPSTKIDTVIAALRGAKGASITELMDLTGWQMHSVRGVIAGTLKKKRGLTIRSSKNDGERVYRIVGQA